MAYGAFGNAKGQKDFQEAAQKRISKNKGIPDSTRDPIPKKSTKKLKKRYTIPRARVLKPKTKKPVGMPWAKKFKANPYYNLNEKEWRSMTPRQRLDYGNTFKT